MEEVARDYSEPCTQCSEICWGITSEGKYYCQSCHNVIEKTQEISSSDIYILNAKVSSVAMGRKKKKTLDKGLNWYVCEGFQYVLKQQVEALVTLGACPQIKDEILCNLWRRYLQKSRQAYTAKRLCRQNRSASEDISDDNTYLSENDCQPSSSGWSDMPSCFQSEGEYETVYSDTSLCSNWSTQTTNRSVVSDAESVCSGSVDGVSYYNGDYQLLMTMPMTLSLCYMALLWLRESITVVDLLRFVTEGHIPYINTFQYFPEEMKLYGPDVKIFRVQCLPSCEEILKKMHNLAVFLDLPRFPPITERCFLHPDILCIRYLMEANLPDEIHTWTSKMSQLAGLQDMTFLTYDPMARAARVINYDVLAVALIVVVLKLFFVLDDKSEWWLSNIAEEKNATDEGSNCFIFRKWYKIMKICLREAERKMEEDVAREIWKSEKPLFYSLREKPLALKRRRMVVSLQQQFDRLVGSPQKKKIPSSFQFTWDEENTDKPCFHGQSLKHYLVKKNGSFTPVNNEYWLCTLKPCHLNHCKHLTKCNESNFSDSYLFVLQFFSFLLRVDVSTLHAEVEFVEYNLVKKYKPKRKRISRLKIVRDLNSAKRLHTKDRM
ncbi:TATA box-binding protein-associated factor RNA polymerase I subunit B isoform X2 [Protopterus annectens]|uniref:TATA box-binding protein-associated factor RNA polymerase I subunit B isoform X2 n=1 Tax=Protopterus annectens TaxID=7888 RepID=UPI001CFA1FC6|nr:TATA box-binding protein-associated factor RNA polymerase I subunit B isoform X2 [Protopterus annectens]